MKHVLIVLCLFLSASADAVSRQRDFPGLAGPYLGQKPPADTARPFASAFFGSMFRSFHSGIIFTPDGNSACWQAMLNRVRFLEASNPEKPDERTEH